MIVQFEGVKRTFTLAFGKQPQSVEVDADELLQVLGGCFEPADYVLDGVDTRFGFRGKPQ